MQRVRGSLIIAVVMVLTATGILYLVKKPSNDAEAIMRVLRQIQVNRTPAETLTHILAAEGLDHVRAICGPASRPQYHMPGKGWMPLNPARPPNPPYTLGWVADTTTRECRYHLPVANTLLHHLRLDGSSNLPIANALLYRLNLAPPSEFSGSITTNGKVVTSVGFHSVISAPDHGTYAAYIDAEQIDVPPGCGEEICMMEVHITPPGFPGLRIDISPSVALTERNLVFSLNTLCFSKIGGCKNEHELLPIAKLR